MHQLNSSDPYTIDLQPRRVMHLYELARSAWPSLDIPRKQFLDYLEERTPRSVPPGECRVQELYLACGCAYRLPEAIRLFERQYLARLRGRLAHELYWQLRVSLLVAEPGRLPRIGAYAGREPLLGWLLAAVSSHAPGRDP